MDNLRPFVQDIVQAECKRMRHRRSRVFFPTFTEGYFVLASHVGSKEGQKNMSSLVLPTTYPKALSDYVFPVEDLLTGEVQEIHGTRLKFYQDSS